MGVKSKTYHNALLLQGDCRELMARWGENQVESIVTDPPYDLGFMGKSWDSLHSDFHYSWAVEAFNVLKPGGHMLVAGIGRTVHRMICAVEDAGFEVRDQIYHVFGTGFPKGLDLGKHLDSWEGWGTGLKPAVESWTLFRKPISEKNVALNVLRWGVGGLNIDVCRIGKELRHNASAGNKPGGNSLVLSERGMPVNVPGRDVQGRFPANLIHDGSEEAIEGFSSTATGYRPKQSHAIWNEQGKHCYGSGVGVYQGIKPYNDSGSAARFFYCAKAGKSERGEGNNHPTVKPLALMRYLCRLITPPDGIVLDPFMGSGTTVIAAIQEGFGAIGMEQDHHYYCIAKRRIGNEIS